MAISAKTLRSIALILMVTLSSFDQTHGNHEDDGRVFWNRGFQWRQRRGSFFRKVLGGGLRGGAVRPAGREGGVLVKGFGRDGGWGNGFGSRRGFGFGYGFGFGFGFGFGGGRGVGVGGGEGYGGSGSAGRGFGLGYGFGGGFGSGVGGSGGGGGGGGSFGSGKGFGYGYGFGVGFGGGDIKGGGGGGERKGKGVGIDFRRDSRKKYNDKFGRSIGFGFKVDVGNEH